MFYVKPYKKRNRVVTCILGNLPGLTNGILKNLWSWATSVCVVDKEEFLSLAIIADRLASIKIEVGALMLLSRLVFFLRFLAFQAWYTFNLRWNTSLQASSKSMSQEVLIVSRSSAYFHFERSYFEATMLRLSRCWLTKADRTSWGIWRSSTVELFSIARRSASSWSRRSC